MDIGITFSIQIGFEEELDARMEAQMDNLSTAEKLVFRFRDAVLYYKEGQASVNASIKNDVLAEFGRILDEHYHTKRMQTFFERYPWLIK